MKRVICWLLGHEWLEYTWGASLCTRCRLYVQTKIRNKKYTRKHYLKKEDMP